MKPQLIYPIAGKYTNEPVDVSVIVPMYKSDIVIKEQILRWTDEKGLNVEIVYVDDNCPRKSYWSVFKAWNQRPDKADFLVKIVQSRINNGFGRACNLGAHHARGKYLVFLNADTTTTPNWIKPMIDVLDDESIGVVGNLQLKEGGQWHGTIDSAGSEWSWEYMNFVHIGRHIHKGELLDKPQTLEDAPKDVLESGEREMVTGCCLAMTKSLFQKIGGFDHRYKVGYWEDSELCMAVRSLGYKVAFTSESIVYHKLHHSSSSGHNLHHRNKEVFADKWIASGRLDSLVGAKRNLPMTKVSNILVNRAAAHGDVLAAAAVLPALKKQFPHSKLYFRTSCPEVLRNNPHIEKVISDEELQSISFQLIYDLDLCYESRPVVNFLNAYAEECGVKIDDCELFLYDEPVEHLPEKYVVFHAGHTAWPGRNWKPERFHTIAERVRELGYEIVSVGSMGDHLMPGVDLRGRTTIHQLAHVMKKSQLFIGIDSFPMHVAQAMNTPGVCFFGAILPELRLLRPNMQGVNVANLPCIGCHHKQFPPVTSLPGCHTGTLDCESMLTTEIFWSKVKGILCPKT